MRPIYGHISPQTPLNLPCALQNTQLRLKYLMLRDVCMQLLHNQHLTQCPEYKRQLFVESKPVSCLGQGLANSSLSGQIPSAAYIFVNKVLFKHSHSIAYCLWLLIILGWPKNSFVFLKRFYLFIFRQRGRKRERKYQCMVASCAPPTGDLAHNPGVYSRMGMELATLWFTGWLLIHWATPARTLLFLFFSCKLAVVTFSF